MAEDPTPATRIGKQIGRLIGLVLIAWTFGAWQESLAAGLWMLLSAGLAVQLWDDDA